MSISPDQVKVLRDRTSAGIMDCKRALEKAGGDLDQAAQILREEGVAKADKKTGREAGEGLVAAYVTPAGDAGALVEVNCETDFVARNDRFAALASELAEQVCAEGGVPDVGVFLDRPARIGPPGQTVGQRIKETIARLGENIVVRRAAYVAAVNGRTAAYVHGGKIGVLVEVGSAGPAVAGHEAVGRVARDVAMQVAAMSPRWVRREDVPPAVLEREKAVLRAQPDVQAKPAAMQEKIVLGRLGKFYAESCLLEQPYIRDESKKATVGDVLGAAGQTAGAPLEVRRFVRLKVGEDVTAE